MRRRTRLLFLASTVTAFLVAAPIVVLTASGFRFSIGNRSLYRVGMLTVSTDPRGAVVRIDESRRQTRTPARLSLSPGDHSLTISKESFLPWTTRVTVYSGQSTGLSDVTLLRDALPRPLAEEVGEKRIPTVSPSQTLVAFLTDTESGQALFSVNRSSGVSNRIASVEGTVDHLEWSPSERSVLLARIDRATRLWQLVDQPSGTTVPIPDSPAGPLQALHFAPGRDDLFYALSGTTVFAMTRKDRSFTFTPLTGSEQAKGLVVHAEGAAAITVDASGTARLVALQPDVPPLVIASLPHEDFAFIEPANVLAVIDQQRVQTIVYAKQGSTFLAHEFPVAARSVEASRDGTTMLIRNDTDLWYIQSGSQKLIGRYASGLGAALLFGPSMVFFTLNDQMVAYHVVLETTVVLPVEQGGTPTLLAASSEDGSILYALPLSAGDGLYEQSLR